MEPYRIRAVEPLPRTTRQQREDALCAAGYNLFRVPASAVTIDLLTDSGTGAMSTAQWAALFLGDESYAGAVSWEHFNAVVTDLTGFEHVLPVHQGRAAERLLFTTATSPRQVVVSNTHFDTTRANAGLVGAIPVDLPSPQAADLASDHPFKGDIDLVALDRLLRERRHDIAMVLMTVTNNAGGGQPVSLDNLQRTRQLCTEAGVPLFLDACRFAENAYLISQREPAAAGMSIRDIARSMFRLADGATMSLKKDGLGNIGGFLAMRDSNLARRCTELLIATEGYATYGGLAGRDLEALAVGLVEVTDPDYLAARHQAAIHLASALHHHDVPTVRPPGCHAIYIDAGRLLPHIPPDQFPGHALAVDLYRTGGIRSCEMGTLVFGAQTSPSDAPRHAPHELLRLALPRRTYTHQHLDHVAGHVAEAVHHRHEIPGYRLVAGDGPLRHFTGRFEPLPGATSGA